jgi:adenylate cyclase
MNNLRLRPSILTAFVVLTVPVFIGIIAVNYISNDRIARENAQGLIDRFRVDAVSDIEDDINPIRSLIRAAATLGTEMPDYYGTDRSIAYFQSLLPHSDKIVSAYVGLADGSFRQARRVDAKGRIGNAFPPPQSVYASRVIDPAKDKPLLDRYTFFDKDWKEVGKLDDPTAYDPRTRGWYRWTVAEKGKLHITDPDIFAALGLVGFTVAQPFYRDGAVAGVAAIDITLDGLSEYLAQRNVSPGTTSYILDRRSNVLAASDKSRNYVNNNGVLELRHISSLDNGLPVAAFAARPRGMADVEAKNKDGKVFYSFFHGGREYVASLSTLPTEFDKLWQIFIITPVDDFTGAFRKNNNNLLIFGLIAIALQIAIISFLSGVISRPLERLARNVGTIKDLEAHKLPPVPSPVREIATLSKAIDTLDNAIQSFSAFVPVGLVRQLLESDQKLALGGHSRFLSIFFCDVESFASISEEMPSQELLQRVSAYLEIVIKAVNEQRGTIDKFMGDGVMAFWGAPALLEDHAWRACVASLAIQRDMNALNAAWGADGRRPFNVRVGVHCDAVVVGNVGSRERMSYTVLGDGVNIASRLEAINKDYGTRVCVSHSVYREAGERLCVRPIDDVAVKGRRAKFPIYELMGVYGAGAEFEPDATVLELARMSRLAYEAMAAGDGVKARTLYAEVTRVYPGDPVATEMIKRLGAS